MKSAVYFFLGLILGAAGGAFVAKSIAQKKAEDDIEQATIEARNYYKEKFEKQSKPEEKPKQDSVFGDKDDLEANKKLTRIYGNQFELYSEPKEHIKPDPKVETYAVPIDEDEFGEDSSYSVHYLDYYSNGILVDMSKNVIEDPVHLIGGDPLDDLLSGRSEEIFARNDVTKSYYNVCYVASPFEELEGEKE